MVALANELEQMVASGRFRTERIQDKNGVTIYVHGRNGTAEVGFTDDGILAVIDGDVIHSWIPLPNSIDMKASAKKIRELIG